MMQKHVIAGAGCCGTFVFGVLFGWVIFPKMLKGQLKKEMALSPKTDVRAMWEQIPFPLELKVWLFNYTNYEDVQKGAKPIVEEVGPYFFEEWKSKVEVKDCDENDTITYRRLDVFLFDRSRSGAGLTGDEVIFMPNIILLAIPQTVLRDKPSLLKTAAKGLPPIFDEPETIFTKVKAMDIMFRGNIFNCSQKAFAPKAVCTKLKSEPSVRFMEGDQVHFSLFGLRNATPDAKVVTVLRGTKNVMDVGKVVAVDGLSKLNVWRDRCNLLEGTDGTVFPPFLTKDDRIETYSTDLYRSFKPTFQSNSKYKKIKTHRYVSGIGDLSTDPELICLCPSNDACPKKGLMDIFNTGMGPLYVSSPHYLDCDPSLLEDVDGLDPDWEKHGLYLDFEPISGTPMLAKQRIMFSMQLMKIPSVPLFAELPDTIAPLFWLEEVLALNDTFVGMLKSQLFLPMKIVKILKWLMVLGGLLGALSAAAYHLTITENPKQLRVRQTTSAATSKVEPLPEERSAASSSKPSAATLSR